METAQKVAGIADTTNPNDEQSPAAATNPPPIPLDASEVDAAFDPSRRGSRASVPQNLNRRPSQKSLRSAHTHTTTAPEDRPPLPSSHGAHTEHTRTSHESRSDASDDDDFTWGPSHPCFPHPNPHCEPNSAEFHSTRVIRVRRDWLLAGDLYPQYANLYPEILDPLVSDDDFRLVVSNLNARLKTAFDPFTTHAWLDSVLGAATGFLWDDLGLTGAKRGMKGVEEFVDKWNREKEREGKPVRLVQVRKTGFMSLDFVIPDPGMDGDGDGAEGMVEGGYEEGHGGIGPAM